MLITRPNHDTTTTYLFAWSRALIMHARKIGRRVVDLSKKRANATEFASVIKKIKPSFIVLNGHGDERSVAGHDDEVLVTTANAHILHDSVVYARSCRSAKLLGKASVKSGCRAYIGYEDDFVFVTEQDILSSPLHDKTAALFLEPANHVVTSLLKGHSAMHAHQRSKWYFKRNIQSIMTSAATADEKDLIPFLVWDYQCQVIIGDGEAGI